MRLTTLLHHVTVDALRWAFFETKKNAAAGVDGITWRNSKVPTYIQKVGYGAVQNGYALVRIGDGLSSQATVKIQHAFAPSVERVIGREQREGA